MYVDIVISNVFDLNEHFSFLSFLLPCPPEVIWKPHRSLLASRWSSYYKILFGSTVSACAGLANQFLSYWVDPRIAWKKH